MGSPRLSADVIYAALAVAFATTACSKAPSASPEPAAAAPAASAPAAESAAASAPVVGAAADPAPPAAVAASAAPSARPIVPSTARTAGSTTGKGDKKRDAEQKNDQMSCAASGCTGDMKKGTP